MAIPIPTLGSIGSLVDWILSLFDGTPDEGDILVGGPANEYVRLPVGPSGYIIQSDGTTVVWAPGELPAPTAGAVLVADGDEWTALAAGAPSELFAMDGASPAWLASAPGAILVGRWNNIPDPTGWELLTTVGASAGWVLTLQTDSGDLVPVWLPPSGGDPTAGAGQMTFQSGTGTVGASIDYTIPGGLVPESNAVQTVWHARARVRVEVAGFTGGQTATLEFSVFLGTDGDLGTLLATPTIGLEGPPPSGDGNVSTWVDIDVSWWARGNDGDPGNVYASTTVQRYNGNPGGPWSETAVPQSTSPAVAVNDVDFADDWVLRLTYAVAAADAPGVTDTFVSAWIVSWSQEEV